MAVRRLVSFFLPVLLIGFSTVAGPASRTTPRRSPPQYPNVIVITLDTTRAIAWISWVEARADGLNLDSIVARPIRYVLATTVTTPPFLRGLWQFNHHDFRPPLPAA